MNNDTNKIMGIGAIKNHPTMNKYHVYDYGNYNRYVYVGKNRIDRSEMTEQEELAMKIFDILCFKGNTHMKRAQGLKMFPIDMLYRMSRKKDLVDFITNMFKNRFQEKKLFTGSITPTNNLYSPRVLTNMIEYVNEYTCDQVDANTD